VRARALIAVAVAAAVLMAAPAGAATFTPAQRAVLHGIARDTWRFYAADVDPVTQLPLDNLGPGATRGAYTSAANIGVYLWAVVAARDLGLISPARADGLAGATLREVAVMKRYHGFLYQWYDTSDGKVLSNPGQGDCTETTPAQDPCWFVSAVDNGWYASGLIEARRALPGVRRLADSLLAPMDFSIFYDSRPQTDCNVNASLPGDPPTGQMYGGVYVESDSAQPAGYHNSALYSDPRIAMYIGMGRHQMPGDVWWRSWRTPPPRRCATDPAPSGDPGAGHWQTYTDPVSGRSFPVWEGHYTYGTSPSPKSLTFVPTFAGGMFEGLMANLVVPETTWGKHSFGLDDVRWAQVQVRYATQALGYPVWGMSPSSTADDTGGYGGFGVEGQVFGASAPLAWCTSCASEDTVSPHASAIALPVLGSAAFSNLEALRADYPGIYTANGGFYDAVNPVTGAIGHRRLVLDQSMIMAALDDALNRGALQRYFAADPESWAARLYLSTERMSIR
jgi:hypothetical protein